MRRTLSSLLLLLGFGPFGVAADRLRTPNNQRAIHELTFGRLDQSNLMKREFTMKSKFFAAWGSSSNRDGLYASRGSPDGYKDLRGTNCEGASRCESSRTGGAPRTVRKCGADD